MTTEALNPAQRDWHETEARQRLLADHAAAGARGAASLATDDPYKRLSPVSTMRIKAQMREWFPWPGDPLPVDNLPAGFREVLERTLDGDRARWKAHPGGVPGRRSDRKGADLGRPEFFTPETRRQKGQGPVHLDCRTGFSCSTNFPRNLPEKYKPVVLELPGEDWDQTQADWDLGRVRWATGRPVLWLQTPDSPCPA
jgi:hypothetical protein